MKRKNTYVIIKLIILFSFTSILYLNSNSPSDYLLKNYSDVTEILYQEKIDSNKYIVFFRDENNSIFCAIIKEQLLGYRTLRISGKCNIRNPGYICSNYNENKDDAWVAWGLITDKDIIGVRCDGIEMKIVECTQYNYRFCWIIGSGKTPIEYAESYF